MLVLIVAWLSIGSDKQAHCRESSNVPNIIFILADDLGYGDLSCHGSTYVKTPHIDQLAELGIRFSNFHSTASICSPSRASFLTGAYPQRCGLYMGINPNRETHWFLGLNPDEITIAEQLKKKDYRTLHVGKWHLGTEPELLPSRQGFDTSYGMRCNYAHSKKFWDGDRLLFAETDLTQLTQLYTDRIVRYIHENRDRPFFIYYAHNYPHSPCVPSERFAGSSQDGPRGDVIQEFDWSVGQIAKTLEEEGLDRNTIVIFTSDNGPIGKNHAGPYRGGKFTTWEGGHRVPMIVCWPDTIKTPAVLDVPINANDLFPTLSEIVGQRLPTDRLYDGISFLPDLTGQESRIPTNRILYYYNCENLQAIAAGPWKLHLPRQPGWAPWWDRQKLFVDREHPALYNLSAEPSEETDVAGDNPETVQRLLLAAERIRQELGEFGQRGSGQRATGSILPDVPVVSRSAWGETDREASILAAEEKVRREGSRP